MGAEIEKADGTIFAFGRKDWSRTQGYHWTLNPKRLLMKLAIVRAKHPSRVNYIPRQAQWCSSQKENDSIDKLGFICTDIFEALRIPVPWFNLCRVMILKKVFFRANGRLKNILQLSTVQTIRAVRREEYTWRWFSAKLLRPFFKPSGDFVPEEAHHRPWFLTTARRLLQQQRTWRRLSHGSSIYRFLLGGEGSLNGLLDPSSDVYGRLLELHFCLEMSCQQCWRRWKLSWTHVPWRTSRVKTVTNHWHPRICFADVDYWVLHQPSQMRMWVTQMWIFQRIRPRDGSSIWSVWWITFGRDGKQSTWQNSERCITIKQLQIDDPKLHRKTNFLLVQCVWSVMTTLHVVSGSWGRLWNWLPVRIVKYVELLCGSRLALGKMPLSSDLSSAFSPSKFTPKMLKGQISPTRNRRLRHTIKRLRFRVDSGARQR